jgi:hypothetical protein
MPFNTIGSGGSSAALLAVTNKMDETAGPMTLRVAAGGNRRLRLVVEDGSAPELRIEASDPGVRLGITAGGGLSLRKYVGGRYGLQYDAVPAGLDSFQVACTRDFSGAFLAEIVWPGGESAPLADDGVVRTQGKTGTYRIMLTFMKRADFKLTGPDPVVWFETSQEVVPLRARWGHPRY